MSGNAAKTAGGLAAYGGTSTLTDTIVAGNTDPSGGPSDIGTLKGTVSGSYNLIGTGGSGGLTSGVGGNIVSVASPLLAPLGDYGGPTLTFALLPGSPAIGNGTAIPGITTDQRGLPLNLPVPDIGAFQTNPLIVSTTVDGGGSRRSSS